MIRPDPVPPVVLPQNVAAWQVWCAASTQWRMGPNGPIGLDLVGVRVVAELANVWSWPLLRQLRILEQEQLRIWSQ